MQESATAATPDGGVRCCGGHELDAGGRGGAVRALGKPWRQLAGLQGQAQPVEGKVGADAAAARCDALRGAALREVGGEGRSTGETLAALAHKEDGRISGVWRGDI